MNFKEISICGRLAYSIICLRMWVKKNIFDSHYLECFEMIFEKFDFGLKKNFHSNFEKTMTELSPYSILENHPDNIFSDYEFFKENELIKLEECYNFLNPVILEIIARMIELTLCNLYSQTGEYSKCTLDELYSIIQLYNDIQFSLPEVPEEILSSHFTENNGWGNEITIPSRYL